MVAIGRGLRLGLPGVLLVVAGCGAGGSPAGAPEEALVPGGIAAGTLAIFDSASAAYAAGDVHLARTLFAVVLEQDSTLAAAWLGLHLADLAARSGAVPDSSLVRARRLVEPPVLPRGRGRARPAT